jgi:NAD(P)-dependent dehydrogenase (short-subunit alcohol dehydrogenase family)
VGDIVLYALDVREPAQIATLAAAVAQEGIDVLIHNAGVSGRRMPCAEVMVINAEAPNSRLILASDIVFPSLLCWAQ